MSYLYKTTDPRVLDAWNNHLTEKAQMNADMKALAALFDAEAVFVRNIHGVRFHGLQLKGFNERSDADLWTKPSRDFKVSRPRATCKGKADELKALQEKYKALMPTRDEASYEPIYNALGFEWGALFLQGGFSAFEFSGTLYVKTPIQVKNATEILSSEFNDARKAFEGKQEVTA